MKRLSRSIPVFALVLVSCSASNTPVAQSPTTAPVITKFTPDTVWTFDTLTIYGNYFGYGRDDVRVTFDTAPAEVLKTDDTILQVQVPETATSGPIHIATINGSTVSVSPVVVKYTFSPHSVYDTLPVGASFSIPGTGMNNYRGTLELKLGTILLPIDSIFPDRIVSHVIPNSSTGYLYLWDSAGPYSIGMLEVTRASAWNTLSMIWDHVTVIETHHRTGYVNGPANQFDSTWQTTVTYLGQRDINISGIPFLITGEQLEYTVPVPSLQITWDTVRQTAYATLQIPYSYSQTPTHTIDSSWNMLSASQQLPLPVGNAIELTMSNYYYQITEDSSDTQGLVNWQETTDATFKSGSFDLVLKP